MIDGLLLLNWQHFPDLVLTLMIPGDTLAPVQSIWGLQLLRLLVTKLSLTELKYFVAISPGVGWGGTNQVVSFTNFFV